MSCFFIINCVDTPPATGYLTELNPAGTGLIYSTFFNGTQTDTIDFAAFTPNGVYLGGQVSSADLPGFTGYPQQCLPQRYESRLSAAGTEIAASRIAPGKVLSYDGAAGTLIASSGSSVVAFDPGAPAPPIACILDSADLQPITSIAPGELLSLFGEFSTGSPAAPPPGQTAETSLNGVTVAIDGIPSPLLYASAEQINFQAPFGIAGAAQANVNVVSTLSKRFDFTHPSDCCEQPGCISHHGHALPAARHVYRRGLRVRQRPPARRPYSDGSVNNCLNPAAAGRY